MPARSPRLTALQFAALAMYEEGPRHPYDVYQEMLRRREDTLVKVRPGTLYHAINRLAADGLLEEHGTDREGNRPERTSYAITDEGVAAATATLREMLGRVAEEYPEFALGVAESSILPPADVADLLSRRADQLRGRLAELDAAEAAVRAKDLPEILWIELTWLRATMRADLDWTECTMARLRSGDLHWEPRH
ncbi:Transcriptional regulator, PadR family [Nostocoides japonicum T1-X7]|uniref:Transcriptional regulator, PadR family n=1 Tax=Nostocoides japonicum T1-X7 TaxID=1194083 RepID=A0A077M6S7_9MICO|nr:PadR family transcriptional regulator [Tetrasphaera japonica]CCH79879.1 Transcriptional regulator, PadR family [Tetrasphaera japonica T1-X7]